MMIIINRFDHDFRVAGARQSVSEQRKKRKPERRAMSLA